MFCCQQRFDLPTRVITEQQFWALVKASRTAKLVDEAREALAKGDKVVLTGFGTFDVRERSQKRCLNPRTREPMQLPAGKAPAFKAGRGLKDAVNKK